MVPTHTKFFLALLRSDPKRWIGWQRLMAEIRADGPQQLKLAKQHKTRSGRAMNVEAGTVRSRAKILDLCGRAVLRRRERVVQLRASSLEWLSDEQLLSLLAWTERNSTALVACDALAGIASAVKTTDDTNGRRGARAGDGLDAETVRFLQGPTVGGASSGDFERLLAFGSAL
jgi:hypothetical protein